MKRFLLIIAMLGLAGSYSLAQVTQNGNLSVNGNRIVNQSGEAVSFSGMSYFWSNQGWGAERFYNAQSVAWLKNDWGASIVRAAMGVEDAGGYIDNPANNKARVQAVVDGAIANDMYVIIDWHSHHAEWNTAEAVSFFQEMATLYGNTPNVIYEIYNEPLQVSWSGTIKPYAETVVNAIRAIDPDNLIIVGTPTWSQDVDQAANDPINNTNIAYTLHFYAGTHFQSLRDKANYALSQGVALMVTEWGTVNANGDGGVAQASTDAWVDWMKANDLTNCNWSVHDKVEGASALQSGASSNGGWSAGDLTPSGTKVKSIISGWGGGSSGGGDGGDGGSDVIIGPGGTYVVPGSVEAENFTVASGIQTEPCSEGGLNVGYMDAGDWVSYDLDVTEAGDYEVSYRVASRNGGGSIRMEQNEGTTVLGTLNVPNTGGWQTWTTISHTVTLAAGLQSVAIGIPTGGYNVNYITFAKINGNDPGNGGSGQVIARIEAEDYTHMSGIQTENCSEGGLNVGWIDAGDWMSFHNVSIPSAGTYTISYRVASRYGGGSFNFEGNSGATNYGNVSVPNTGGWQNWTTVSHTVNLPAGSQNFGIGATGGGWNINWFEITSGGSARGGLETGGLSWNGPIPSIYPNPAVEDIHLAGYEGAFDHVQVLSLNSQQVLEQSLAGRGTETLSVSDLKPGVYLLLFSGDHHSYSTRFIKQ
ncbi:MAG: cellulase family glycosylhydrolase [Bacteroidota bacterium]